VRRSWRIASALALLLAAGSFLFSARLYSDIQQSRIDICREGNARHDDVIATLDRLIREQPAGAQKRRAVRNRAQTVALLEALAPKRDCEHLVRPR
jgi:Tfp pilus assembly protein PilN